MKRSQQFRIAIRRFAPFESAIQKQWDAFEAVQQTGLQLDPVALDLHPLSTTLIDEGGLLRGEWDVAFISTDWLAAVAATGSSIDLTPWIRQTPPDGFPEAWTESLLRMQEIEGKILGLPYHDGPECLIYRKDLFENSWEQTKYEKQFSTALRPPDTWIDFRQVARFFQRPEEGIYGTVLAAYPDGHNTVYDFLLQLWTRGGELFDGSQRVRFETDQTIEALQFYRSMLQDSAAVHPESRTIDSVASGLAFARGEVAMMVNWFGFAAVAERKFVETDRGQSVGIAPVPRAIGGRHISLNAYWVLVLASGAVHREIGYAFMRHCASPEMDKLLTTEGGIGCRKSTWSDAEVNANMPFYARLEELHASAREIPQIVEWPSIASRIDAIVLAAINTDRPIRELVREADLNIATRHRQSEV